MALIELVHNWLRALETAGSVVCILFLDFHKAFDRVDHNILVFKLSSAGVPQCLMKWIHSFLENRQQRVKLGGHLSNWKGVTAGVLQGTLFGPITFLWHINDLSTTCQAVKHVDDSTIWEHCNRDGSNSKQQTKRTIGQRQTRCRLIQKRPKLCRFTSGGKATV